MGQGLVEVKTPAYAWVILVVAFIASVAAPVCQFKVPPVMPILVETFNLNLMVAGSLMSVFAICGFLLALPAGMIMHKLGVKLTALLAMACLIIGSVIGSYSSTVEILLSSRFIEGVGMGLISVAAPAVVAMWFPPVKRGLPLGIWNSWIPVAALLTFNVAPVLNARFGWQSVWWFGAAFATAAFLLVALFLRMPPAPAGGIPAGGPPAQVLNMRQALSNRNIWLLSCVACAYAMALIGISTFYVHFLTEVRDYNMRTAAMLTSLVMIVGGLCGPLWGIISDRIGSRKIFLSWPFLMIVVMMLFPFTVTGAGIPVWLVLFGVVSSTIPMAMFTSAPAIMGKPQWAGLGMATVSLGQNLGLFIGPMLFGHLVHQSSWAAAGYWMIPILVVGFVTSRIVKVK